MKKVLLSSVFAAYAVLNNAQMPPAAPQASCTSSCAFTFTPVCGVDNQVYLNRCLASCLGIGIRHDGECGTQQQTPPAPPAPPVQPGPVQIVPAQPAPQPPPAPITPAPTTPAPTTPAPTTPAPTTRAPTTRAPTTAAPTTGAPTKYINPYCPADLVFLNIGSPPPAQLANSILATCYESPIYGSSKYASDFDGFVQCNPFACCSCDLINCGGSGVPCKIAKFSDYGAIGAPFINVMGPPRTTLTGVVQLGAEIDCGGLESCKAANILGSFVRSLSCNGEYGCQQSTIILNNPYPHFELTCNGRQSCQGTYIEINIGEAPPPGQICDPNYIPTIIELGEIKFGGTQSGENAVLAINNVGCDRVLIRRLDCPHPTSCGGTQFIFNGNVEVQSCNMPSVPFPSPELARCAAGGIAAPIGRVTCNDPFTCVDVVRTITNPGSGFELECGVTGACNGLRLTLEYGLDPTQPANYISNVAGLYFNAPNSAVGAVINIRNNQNGIVQNSHGQILELNTVKCIVAGACNGLTIKAGPNVDILNTAIDCSVPLSCTGCMFEQEGIMPYPCDYGQPVNAPQVPQQQPRIPNVQQPVPLNPQQVRPVNPFTNMIPAPRQASPWIPAPSPRV